MTIDPTSSGGYPAPAGDLADVPPAPTGPAPGASADPAACRNCDGTGTADHPLLPVNTCEDCRGTGVSGPTDPATAAPATPGQLDLDASELAEAATEWDGLQQALASAVVRVRELEAEVAELRTPGVWQLPAEPPAHRADPRRDRHNSGGRLWLSDAEIAAEGAPTLTEVAEALKAGNVACAQTIDRDLQAFAELPDCPHCDGCGKQVPPGWRGEPVGDGLDGKRDVPGSQEDRNANQ